MYKILLVEDDLNICELITDYFHDKSNRNLLIETANDGRAGMEKAYEKTYDMLLLDVMLPEIDGFELCREIRKHSDIPIMFITAKNHHNDILQGYALGCDDYVVKPFSLAVFYEKVNALLRRTKGLVRENILNAGTISLNPNNGIVISDGEEIKLTAKEYTLLKTLLENKGKIVSRDALITQLWGYAGDVDNRILDTHVKNLRKSLKDNAKIIKTVIGRGYRIEESQ